MRGLLLLAPLTIEVGGQTALNPVVNAHVAD